MDRHLLRDTAYVSLRDAIVTGTLAPGEQLHDSELCHWLGLSRTPVREALSRLEDDGLIETAPQRYTRVAALERRDVHDVFPVLAVLHGLATEFAVPKLEAHHLRALQLENEAFKHALRERAPTEAYAADERFHRVFVTAAGNTEIHRSVDRLAPRLERLERLCVTVLPGRRSVAQHEAILARAAAGDAGGAGSATRANWMTLGGVIEKALGDASSALGNGGRDGG